jgi:predicted sugar kinase
METKIKHKIELYFKVGTILNKVNGKYNVNNPLFNSIKIKFPSRLNAMAIDPSLILPNKDGIYTAGEVVFSIGLYKIVSIESRPGNLIEISDRSERKSLILHAALLMKKALSFKGGLFIDVDNQDEIKHAGLGSSSGLIASVACAINQLYGSLISSQNLVKYLAQNHGEEIENNNEYLCPVQCLGGAAAAGLFKAGMLIITGENTVIATSIIPKKYKVVIGVPKDYISLDSKKLFELEIKNIQKFVNTGEKMGNKIAYNILHKMLPAMVNDDMSSIGDVIYDYRFNMGSINNCSFAYPKINKLAKDLSILKKNKLTPILSLSSVGPGFFVITEHVVDCKKYFKKVGLSTIVTTIENSGYKII